MLQMFITPVILFRVVNG